MDANGLRFWLLADERHFPARSRAVWDHECRVLKLASERTLPPPADSASTLAAATSALERVPRALDAYGGLARWIDQPDESGNVGLISVTSRHLPGDAVLVRLPARPSDFTVGHDGVVYIVLEDGVLMHDLRARWPSETVREGGFVPWRIAADASGGAWLLDRTNGRLAHLDGLPLPRRPHADYAHTTFRPCPENPRPPAIHVLDSATWPVGERPLALASHPRAGLLLLSWTGDGEAHLRRLDGRSATLGPAIALAGARYAYALAWLDDARLAVRMPGRRDAPAFSFDDGEGDAERRPLGEVYPLADDALEAPFVHRLDGPPHYPTNGGADPLHALSIANLARHGTAANFDAVRIHLLDSGSQQTVWHRLYAEASIPAGAAFTAWVAATSDPEPPATDGAWCAHHFGPRPRTSGPHEPQAVWEALPSELPAHPGLGPWPRERDRAGLYSVLVQDVRRRVRAIQGRYLWIRLELFGDGRVGPEIAAMRAWGSRFSYRDQYLPRIYRETLYGAAAQSPGERLDGLDVAHTPALDSGGRPPPELAARIAESGVQLGGAPEVRVESPGASWLLTDGASGRSWRLQRESHAIGIYRPQATPADFLERFLASFEAVLTPLEDRVGAAHLLTDPRSTAAENLDWLGAWIGIAFDPALPAPCRRAWLQAAPELARRHGTRRGLALALDIASGGAVRGGEIIVLENFRLRRLLATLLGVDLADETDPLLPGLTVSGNSVVGDTLILGEAERVELLALFREEV
ncbi:MAG: phage tail protein, partial [Burkholderiales bacterium]